MRGCGGSSGSSTTACRSWRCTCGKCWGPSGWRATAGAAPVTVAPAAGAAARPWWWTGARPARGARGCGGCGRSRGTWWTRRPRGARGTGRQTGARWGRCWCCRWPAAGWARRTCSALRSSPMAAWTRRCQTTAGRTPAPHPTTWCAAGEGRALLQAAPPQASKQPRCSQPAAHACELSRAPRGPGMCRVRGCEPASSPCIPGAHPLNRYP